MLSELDNREIRGARLRQQRFCPEASLCTQHVVHVCVGMFAGVFWVNSYSESFSARVLFPHNTVSQCARTMFEGDFTERPGPFTFVFFFLPILLLSFFMCQLCAVWLFGCERKIT